MGRYLIEAPMPLNRPGLLFFSFSRKTSPLVFSSSKTSAEIEIYRRKLENDHPFISENGGAMVDDTGPQAWNEVILNIVNELVI